MTELAQRLARSAKLPLVELLVLAGLALVVLGAAMVYTPAAVILAGVLVVALAIGAMRS